MARGSWLRCIFVGVLWGLVAGTGGCVGFQREYYEFWFTCAGDGDIPGDVRLVSMARVAYAYPDGPFRLDPRVSLEDLITWGSEAPRYSDLRCHHLVGRFLHEARGGIAAANADVDLDAFTERFHAADLRLRRDMQSSAYMTAAAAARRSGRFDRGADLFGQLYLLESPDGPVWAWELMGELQNDHLLHEIAAVRGGEVLHQRHFFQDVSGYEGFENVVGFLLFIAGFVLGYSWEETLRRRTQRA